MRNSYDFDSMSGANPLGPEYQIEGPKGGGSKRKIFMGVGCGCGSLIVILMVVFIFWAAGQPSNESIPGAELNQKVIKYLEDQAALEPGENIIYYYGWVDFEDIEEKDDDYEACFFTDRKVAHYKTGALTTWFPWAEVDSVDGYKETFNFVVTIRSRDHQYLKCEMIAEGPDFYNALKSFFDKFKKEGK